MMLRVGGALFHSVLPIIRPLTAGFLLLFLTLPCCATPEPPQSVLTSPYVPGNSLVNYVVSIHDMPSSTNHATLGVGKSDGVLGDGDAGSSSSDTPEGVASKGSPEASSSLDASVAQVMTSADGKKFVCYFPPNAPEASDEKERQTNEKIEKCAEAIAGLESCAQLRKGSWTYEVCPGRHIRQFREQAGITTTQWMVMHRNSSADRLGTLPDGRVSYVQSFSHEDRTPNSPIAIVRYECPASPSGKSMKARAGKSLPSGITTSLVDVNESPVGTYHLLVHAQSAQLCAQLESTSQLLAPLNGTCVHLAQGWWTYELCMGKAIRQFHADPVTGAIEKEYLLGKYDWKQGEPIVPAGQGRPAAVIQHYPGGDLCDLSGTARETRVRYECAADGTQFIKNIREHATCVYEVTVGSPLVCEHPAIAVVHDVEPRRPPVSIDCHPQVELTR